MRIYKFLLCSALTVLSISCRENSGENGTIYPAENNTEYVLFAWNDLGMHCLNPTYDTLVILPPYNTIEAQLVKRGNPPLLITDATIEYTIEDNSYSYGKKDYGQFWDNMPALFSTTKLHDIGLDDKGLSGIMDWVTADGVYRATGIPIVPATDSAPATYAPYQVAVIRAKDAVGSFLVSTKTTVPTSDEINCAKCHGDGSIKSAFQDIISDHDLSRPTEDLAGSVPVLCASCHGSPALGTANSGSTLFLSEAIHGFHSDKDAFCRDCHPGDIAKCNRSLAHTSSDGNCINCHGTMAQVSSTISSDGRIPWVNETKCADCHTSTLSNTLTTALWGSTSSIAEVDTSTVLYRNDTGHGDLRCTACHGSPHAMVPSREEKDNYQALAYQNIAVTIGSCAACHSKSHGEGADEFMDEHGGTDPDKYSACNVCHTAVTSGNTARWPHDFQWMNR